MEQLGLTTEPAGSEWRSIPWKTLALWPWLLWLVEGGWLDGDALERLELDPGRVVRAMTAGGLDPWPMWMLVEALDGLEGAVRTFGFSPLHPPLPSLALIQLKDSGKGGCKGGKPIDRRSAGRSARRQELDWRIDQAWEAHQRQREIFFTHHGIRPGRPMELSSSRRRKLAKLIREWDREHLGPDDRERWTAHSRVRGALVGIFFDGWFAQKALEPGNTHLLSPDLVLSMKRDWEPVERFDHAYRQAQGGGSR